MKHFPKQWIINPRVHDDLITHLLVSRGIDDKATFLHPQFPAQLHDPFQMKDMQKTVDRLVGAIRSGETIGIFADYDTDGTPGAALFADALRQLGAAFRIYIATRDEGYGVSEKGLRMLNDSGCSLVVTIDVGITAQKEALTARSLGIDLIVTDHHVVQESVFPHAAYAVVNPKQADCAYPYKELCGAGVIWKVLCGLLTVLETHHPVLLKGRNTEAIRRWALDLVAIATICDMVPLVGENRVLVTFGLTVLKKTRRLGLTVLYDRAGITPATLSATTVGFQIGPRINAPTRMAAQAYSSTSLPGPQLSPAIALLLTKDSAEAVLLAEQLNTFNTQRQGELERILTEALALVEERRLMDQSVILVAQTGWPVGIVGLVASRLMERYGRPAVVLSIDGATATGSARSIHGVHLVDTLAVARDLLTKFGGHAKAAGLTVPTHAIEELRTRITQHVATHLSIDAVAGPTLAIDAQLEGSEIDLAVARQLESFAPYGIGNHRPNFILPGVHISSRRLVGKQHNHVKLDLQLPQQSRPVSAIAFSQKERFATVADGEPIDVALQLDVSTWNAREQLELRVLDVRPAVL